MKITKNHVIIFSGVFFLIGTFSMVPILFKVATTQFSVISLTILFLRIKPIGFKEITDFSNKKALEYLKKKKYGKGLLYSILIPAVIIGIIQVIITLILIWMI